MLLFYTPFSFLCDPCAFLFLANSVSFPSPIALEDTSLDFDYDPLAPATSLYPGSALRTSDLRSLQALGQSHSHPRHNTPSSRRPALQAIITHKRNEGRSQVVFTLLLSIAFCLAVGLARCSNWLRLRLSVFGLSIPSDGMGLCFWKK